MFSLLQKFGLNNNGKIQSTAPSMPVTRTPQIEREIPYVTLPQMAEVSEAVEDKSFSCLNDVFGELLDEEVSYALSKW